MYVIERQGRGSLETKGDVLIWYLWEIHTDAIIDVRFGDSDADTYKYDPMYKLVDCWDKKKKDNQIKHCHKQRINIAPFPSQWTACLGRRL